MEMREKADITTLPQRRIELLDKFASKCLTSPRSGERFPLKVGARTSRERDKYREAGSSALGEKLGPPW